MIKIEKLNDMFFDSWKKVFSVYWNDITNGKVTIQQTESCINYILKQYKNNEIEIMIALKNNQLIGFCIYQIDSKNKDWCEYEGFGFLREIFVLKEFRSMKVATMLVGHILNQLKESNVNNVYLDTEPNAKVFWEKIGFKSSNTITDFNNEERMFLQI